MIHNCMPEGAPAKRYDVCIAGAGAAGILLALELVRQKKNVLLLESGGRVEGERGARMKQVELRGAPHTGTYDGRFRALGGSTTRWGGQIAEFDEQDFAKRAWIHGSGWPISKSELAPFYGRVYSTVKLDADRLQDESVWRAAGTRPMDAGDTPLYFTRWLREPNFAVMYRSQLEREPLLDLVLNATLVGLDTSKSGRIDAAACVLGDGTRVGVSAEQFVLALGTIESNRFLLQPANDGTRQPWSDSPWLGRHFQDHLAGYCGVLQVKDWGRIVRNFENIYYRGYKYQPKMKLSPAAQEQGKCLNVGGTINFLPREGNRSPLGAVRELLHATRTRNGIGGAAGTVAENLPALAATAWAYTMRHRNYHAQQSTEVRLGVECEQEPEGASRITLTQERDETGLLKASLDWHISALEAKTAGVFARSAAKNLEAAGAGTVALDERLLDGDPGFAANLHDTYHHMGGTRMATNEAEGVVDSQLRIFGTANAFVLSASVFPTSGYSNPTCTLLALAFRLADHLVAATA